MSDCIDVSAGLGPDLPVWPTSRGWSREFVHDVRRGDSVTETVLTADVHSGTHVDAPLHFLPEGGGVETLPPQAFWGAAEVVDATGHSEVPVEAVLGLDRNVQRVLFRTDNSAKAALRNRVFNPSFVGLSVEAARALAARPEVLLVGNDYLSIQPYQGDDEVHRVLLRRGIAVLEGLDLTDVEPGPYELSALPVLIPGAEAAPLRAVLRTLQPST